MKGIKEKQPMLVMYTRTLALENITFHVPIKRKLSFFHSKNLMSNFQPHKKCFL